MKYCIFRMPSIGIAVIPTGLVDLFKSSVPNSECIFTGTYSQCMVYMIEPISLN
jgi:hypothetical protein